MTCAECVHLDADRRPTCCAEGRSVYPNEINDECECEDYHAAEKDAD